MKIKEPLTDLFNKEEFNEPEAAAFDHKLEETHTLAIGAKEGMPPKFASESLKDFDELGDSLVSALGMD